MSRIPKTTDYIIVLLVLAATGAYLYMEDTPATPSPQTQTRDCAEIISNHQQETVLPIFCSVLISPDEGMVGVLVNESGNMTVTRDSTKLISLKNDNGDDDASPNELIISSRWMGDNTLLFDAFKFIDINFDGNLDLQIVDWRGAYNMGYSYYVYNPKTKIFDTTPLLTDVVNAGFDEVSKIITSYSKGRGVGDIFVEETYHFENGKYILVKEVKQDFAGEDQESGYIYTERERVNGTMVITKTERVSKEEFWGE